MRRFIEINELPLGINDQDTVGGLLEQRTIAQLCFAERVPLVLPVVIGRFLYGVVILHCFFP